MNTYCKVEGRLLIYRCNHYVLIVTVTYQIFGHVCALLAWCIECGTDSFRLTYK